ncbi:permease prefix domain 1-containing protein [Cohnella silvisoli]|uniref:Permease prefix domain 1-containing protein n=1 Tax=Cohnella silvisoli TaxID=2873699 RepID=A0ABV1KNI0_9BACL|nr:permease prefix domain 1-containing protein [Cohnella silvisoli]MCD9021066.1 permease prefix domain 1-containing protein [Cohnella silvisoli]
MKKITKHVEEWFRDIPENEHNQRIKEDIIQNLEEKVQDLMHEGKSEEDAINKAIVDFGDIGDIKAELGVNTEKPRNRFNLHLGFSLWGSGLIIALVLFANFYYTPHIIWFVYPTFAVVWWPLAMFYKWLGMK